LSIVSIAGLHHVTNVSSPTAPSSFQDTNGQMLSGLRV
jgi:hypothetical protein